MYILDHSLGHGLFTRRIVDCVEHAQSLDGLASELAQSPNIQYVGWRRGVGVGMDGAKGMAEAGELNWDRER